MAELEKWHNLKEKGIITEDKYNSKKRTTIKPVITTLPAKATAIAHATYFVNRLSTYQ